MTEINIVQYRERERENISVFDFRTKKVYIWKQFVFVLPILNQTSVWVIELFKNYLTLLKIFKLTSI